MNTTMIILMAFLIILITIMAITNLEEYVGSHAATDVVLGDSVVDVRPVRVVDDLAWSWVFLVVGNVIVHHDNDVVVRNSMCVHDLVGVAHVGLVSVVEPTVAAGDQEDPQVPILVRGGKVVCKKSKNCRSQEAAKKKNSHIVTGDC